MQDADEVGRRAMRTPACTRSAVLLSLRTVALWGVVYLVLTSLHDLVTVASGVIRWASARTRPALTSAAVTYLAWAGRRQAQRLWVAVLTSIRRHAPRKRPATNGDLGRDRGAPSATRGLRRAAGLGASRGRSLGTVGRAVAERLTNPTHDAHGAPGRGRPAGRGRSAGGRAPRAPPRTTTSISSTTEAGYLARKR